MYVDFSSVWRHFKEYIHASGGIFELKKALDWSVWYAAKWWREVKEGADLKKPFAKALYISLLRRGIIDERGEFRKEVGEPEMPRGLYAREWVEMHMRFDELGAARVARDEVDRNALELLYSDIQVQGWHRIMVKAFLKAVGVTDGQAVLEPYSREGHLAAFYHEDYRPASYLGYDPSAALLEMAKAVAPSAAFAAASSACELSGRYNAVLLIEKLQWMPDPLRELDCISRLLEPGGRLYVAQPVAESMPGYLAILTAVGAHHVFTWRETEAMLASRFKLERRLIRAMPFYGAVFQKR
ncbi:class I SAM-dependent methyltransferase [Pyrobaculum neutrophilum]|uniref:Methyltransferase type 11 n=1 Tax=Pyrobaculum neutrophilum (strain DSM 2338 / JCM 9278 / NBRC 100436 / V24Sta) TaxID=444157 RepID=B1YBH1_PYRNV|nr:methyltransferase domain-containing protein [Pyrobaculum neutrophilum]ACB40773.1 Methyltransferase type 11 [Pyrobaculum neutrophilum V24Sta]